MPKLFVPFPHAGRVDGRSYTGQPLLTTRSARNVRSRDPVEGRLRGASRAGLSAFNASAIGTGRIKALASTAIDTRKVEFDFTPGAVVKKWGAATPSKLDCRVGVTGPQGDVYALDGNAGIAKFNSAGRIVMKIALPVADPQHIVRALTVDESGRIFAGVSEGGDWRTARMWCVLQLEDDEYHVLWQIEPGAYTERLKVHRGAQLYAWHNYPEDVRARVLIYEGIGLDPREVLRVESVAYPIYDGDILDGALYTASGHTEARVFVPLQARYGYGGVFTPSLVGWTDKDDSTLALWSAFDTRDPESLGEEDVEDADLSNGQQVLRLRDISGNGRHWYAGSLTITGETGPEYLRRGPGGFPCIHFDTGAAAPGGTKKHSLVSFGNSSIDVSLADQQRTPIPAYTGAMWAMFLVIRPSTTATQPEALLFLDNEAAGPASDHILYLNRDSSTSAFAAAAAPGFVSYYATTDATGDGGQGAGGVQSLGYEYNSTVNALHRTGCVLVTILWDGGVEPNDTTKTRCIVRYNGKPIDRFEGLAFASLKEQWLGLVPSAISATGEDVARRFKGDLCAMRVYVRRGVDGTTEPKVVSFDDLETGDPNTDQTVNQITQIEGWIANDWGIVIALPNDDFAGTDYQHPFGHSGAGGAGLKMLGPPRAVTGQQTDMHSAILHGGAVVTKHDQQGVLRWAAGAVTSATAVTGVGAAVRVRKVESDGLTHVWSVAVDWPYSGAAIPFGSEAIRKLIDNGDSYSIAAVDGAWTHTFPGNELGDYIHPRIDADSFGNLFFPGYALSADQSSLHAFQKDGAAGLAVQLFELPFPVPADRAHAVALPPDELMPDYRGEATIAEAVYVFTKAGDGVLDPADSVFRVTVVTTSALTTGVPHEIVTLAVVEDDIRRITESTNVVPTGGSAAIDGSSQYIQAIRAGDDIVVLDGGVDLKTYRLREGTIETLEATSAGEIPPRARYMMFWRHRLVLALEGGLYAASRLGDIRDWNLNPGSNIAGVPLQTSTQAFTGTITRAGEAEDSIVTMIPATDDLAFLVGESRILRLTGDPQDGGNIHLVTDSMGGVFGDSWCKDDRGRVYMFGNPPGLYALRVPEGPLPLSDHTLAHSEFREIDFSTHRILMSWDPVERSVRIFQVAWGDSSIVNHWAYEVDHHEMVSRPPIWTDRIGLATMQPTAVAYLGGDDSRTLLIGCADGFVRKVDPAAVTDDGTPLDSYFVSGPLNPNGMEWRLTEVEVALAADQGGARLELFASEVADDTGGAKHARDLVPGLNRPFRKRVKGEKLFIRVRNAAARRWALESLAVTMEPTGVEHQRRS